MSKAKKASNQGVAKYFSPSQRARDSTMEPQDGGGPHGATALSGKKTQPKDRTPASPDQPITRAYLEELLGAMATTLQSSFQTELRTAVSDIRKEISGLTEKTTTLEKKLTESQQRQSEAEEEIGRLGEEITLLKEAMEEQENRDRRQNIRVRNVPESVAQDQLRPYLMELFNLVCGELEEKELEMDRAHRALGPKSDDPRRRRDIIIKMHKYTSKEKIIAACRDLGEITFQNETLQVYNDLSKATRDRRRELKPLTNLLREKGIQYRWGFPFRLTVNRNGKFLSMKYPVDMAPFAKALGLTPPQTWITTNPTAENTSGDPPRTSERIAAQHPREK
ncbi:hypothetical protein FKM82_026958 [Ascaphus truei]